MKVLLLVIGKTDEDYLITGIKKYVGRLGHYVSFEMKEIPDIRNRKTLSEEQQKKAERQFSVSPLSFFFPIFSFRLQMQRPAEPPPQTTESR